MIVRSFQAQTDSQSSGSGSGFCGGSVLFGSVQNKVYGYDMRAQQVILSTPLCSAGSAVSSCFQASGVITQLSVCGSLLAAGGFGSVVEVFDLRHSAQPLLSLPASPHLVDHRRASTGGGSLAAAGSPVPSAAPTTATAAAAPPVTQNLTAVAQTAGATALTTPVDRVTGREYTSSVLLDGNTLVSSHNCFVFRSLGRGSYVCLWDVRRGVAHKPIGRKEGKYVRLLVYCCGGGGGGGGGGGVCVCVYMHVCVCVCVRALCVILSPSLARALSLSLSLTPLLYTHIAGVRSKISSMDIHYADSIMVTGHGEKNNDSVETNEVCCWSLGPK
jgi:hypothetical protein